MISRITAACLITGCLLINFSGCLKQTDSIKKNSRFSTGLGHPKHFDIPLPATFSATAASSQPFANQIRDALTYHGTLPIKHTIEFYQREMEQAGWQVEDLSGTHEGFLYASKPGKFCGISIRHDAKAPKPTVLTLFVSQSSQ